MFRTFAIKICLFCCRIDFKLFLSPIIHVTQLTSSAFSITNGTTLYFIRTLTFIQFYIFGLAQTDRTISNIYRIRCNRVRLNRLDGLDIVKWPKILKLKENDVDKTNTEIF